MKQWILIGVLSVSSATGFAQSGSVELEEIPNPDPHSYASFGSDVFIQGDQAIVLSKGYSSDPQSNGAFYVYNRDAASGAWQLLQKMVHTNQSSLSEWYGSSAAINGDYFLVGAYHARTTENEAYPAGAAFMYHRNAAGQWEAGQKLSVLAGEKANGQQFGSAVALSDKYAAVVAGATQEVYIFENNGSGSWSFVQKISGKDYLRSDGFKPDFGSSLAIDGDYLYIGAPTDDSDQFGENNLTRSGAIYIFKREGGNWSLAQKVTQQNRQSQSYFGNNISVSGSFLAVGSQENRQGSVEIFQRDRDGKWNFTQKLSPENRLAIDRFGADISFDGDHIAVSAPNYNVEGITYAGAVFLYKRDLKSNYWTIEDIITAPNPSNSERFGNVQLSDGAIAIGVPTRETSNSRYAGVIYVSNLPGSQNKAVSGNESLQLFPNPVRESFKIEVAGKESISDIYVFDYTGRQVNVKFDEELNTVDVKNLSAGVYLLKVRVENGEVYTREFTVTAY
ncbi:MAG TPA: hypothetical protein DIU20_07340 [Cryomorphaceae bacterium]|nr:hypothetical protein [Cryomorphaceae bacterium]